MTMDSRKTQNEDPLSDVVLPGDPTPILYGLHELDYFDAVCRYHGKLGRPWDGHKLSILLGEMSKAAEAVAVVRKASEESPMAVAKESVRTLIREGHSILDIPEMLEMKDLTEAVIALCNGRPSTKMASWNHRVWGEFEDDIVSDVGVTELSRTYGLSRTLIYRLRNLYNGKPGWSG